MMARLIVLMDNGEIKESSHKIAGPKGVANAYAQFAYGGNGLSKKDAMEMAKDAQKQQKLEAAEYR